MYIGVKGERGYTGFKGYRGYNGMYISTKLFLEFKFGNLVFFVTVIT